MAIRFRKKIKVAPGVSLGVHVGKNGVTTGLSAGPKGAKMSVNSKGQVRRNLGIPGTGIYSSEVINNGSKQEVTEKPVVKKPFYKRVWFILLCVVLVFGIFGCVTGVDEDTDTVADTTNNNTITLVAGELGDYGEVKVMNDDEGIVVYYVPSGDYEVKNVGDYRTQVSVYEGIKYNESTGVTEYTEVGDVEVIDPNDSCKITVPDGWFIEIHEPDVIELTPLD